MCLTLYGRKTQYETERSSMLQKHGFLKSSYTYFYCIINVTEAMFAADGKTNISEKSSDKTWGELAKY